MAVPNQKVVKRLAHKMGTQLVEALLADTLHGPDKGRGAPTKFIPGPMQDHRARQVKRHQEARQNSGSRDPRIDTARPVAGRTPPRNPTESNYIDQGE